MGREQERIKKRLEKNPIKECLAIQKKYYPTLFHMFDDVNDPRNSSYVLYPNRVMLGTMYFKALGGISSMQDMTRYFNDDKIVSNLYYFLGCKKKEYLPHYVTINEYLGNLAPSELEKIQQDMVYKMIRRKTFNDAKVAGKWLVIVDGTELDEGLQKKNDNYLERCYHRGTDKEYTRYHRSVLEAKIYFGNNLIASIATEPIENEPGYSYRKMSDEKIKQDCESKAFIRLSEKLKKAFPRLPICILADGLYVSEKVINRCKEYNWSYIIRYKEGCASSIEEEYNAIPEKGCSGNAEFINGIIYKDSTVNVLKYTERKIVKGSEVITEFEWITNIEITEKNAEKLAVAGRNRWKIENQGFNRQKQWQGNIEHACSYNENAQKCHYLIEQIADFIKQLYEYFFLKKNEIKKLQKNISSDLLASFGWQLTTEDISVTDMHSISDN